MFEPFHLLFHKGNSLLAKLIRRFSKYSHVTMFLDEWHCLETAWNKPSVIRHFSYRHGYYDIYKLNIKLTKYQKQIILDYIKKHVKSDYDFIFFITRGLHFLFGTKIINSKNSLSCDELIVNAFKEIGIHLHDENEVLTPESLSKSKYLTKIN